LKQLEELSLNYNLLNQVPDWIVELTNLKSLQLNSNNLSSMPAVFEKIRVVELYLENNRFQRL
jgi:Leucine-rich repeat (LRR) protein